MGPLVIVSVLWLFLGTVSCAGTAKSPKPHRFKIIHPYFLIKGDNGDNTVITTETCESGGFSPNGVQLKSFCVTGIWIVITQVCHGQWSNADDPSKVFVAVGKDTCFDVPDNLHLTARRFMPLLQNVSNFEGSAFAIPSTFSFFVRLCPGRPTLIENMPWISDWWILTVNFDLYDRTLNALEFVNSKRDNATKICFKSETGSMVQIYSIQAKGEVVFEPPRASDGCMPRFKKLEPTGSVVKLGVFQSWPNESDFISVNASSSYIMSKINETQLMTPLDTCLQNYVVTLPQKPYPMFPYVVPSQDVLNELIDEETKETAYKYMDYKVGDGLMPKLNYSEYQYLKLSNEIFTKFCCSDYVKKTHFDMIRRVFRLSAVYFDQYFPYPEKTDPEMNNRLLGSLTRCLARTEPQDTCIRIVESETCPKYIVGTVFNETLYPWKMPGDVQFELGNLDYVTEVMWKTALFTHYLCANDFDFAGDHSAFMTKIEAFFSPPVKYKWSFPKSVYLVYELLFSEIDLKKFSESLDYCVNTAYQLSEYNRWLARPDFDTLVPNTRSKRKAISKARGRSADAVSLPKCSVGQPFACIRNQFDPFEKKLVAQSTTPSACVTSYTKRSSLKSIHKNVFDTHY